MTARKQKAPAKKKASPLEDLFAEQLALHRIVFEREFQALAEQGRKFRWDFYVRPHLLIEINGGIWLGRAGGHSSPFGITRDYQKLNLATVHGFSSLLLTSKDVKNGAGLTLVQDFLLNRAFG